MQIAYTVNKNVAIYIQSASPVAVKPKAPLSLRLDPKVEERLTEAAKRLKLKKYQLAIMAIEAAVEAIEKNDNRLVVPIEFDLVPARVPQPRTRYPEHTATGETSLVEDAPDVTGKIKRAGRKLP